MSSLLKWTRRTESSHNFDLLLTNHQELDSQRIIELLNDIQRETHRALSLSARADKEFRRWCAQPDTPLKSDAYVLLSNWFTTQSGDKRSMVASRCECLFDELFACRPLKRLSSPAPGQNHVIVPAEFDDWWHLLRKAQGETPGVPDESAAEITASALQAGGANSSQTSGRAARPLTITEAKASLALTFGVSPDKVEITIRG